MGALTDLATVKGALRIPAGVTMWNTRVDEIINEVESTLLTDLDLTSFAATTYSEYIDTRYGETMAFISRFPVYSVVALTQNTTTALVENTDFYFEANGRIQLLTAIFDGARRDLFVTYTAGLFPGATTSDAKRLATLLAARQFHQEPLAGYSESSVAPIRKIMANATLDTDAIYSEIKRLMARYVRT